MTDWGNVPRFPWRESSEMIEQFPDKPLDYGATVAWTATTVGGVTAGISEVHRALNDERTLCGTPIPGYSRRMQFIKTQRRCGFCERMHAEQSFGVSA